MIFKRLGSMLHHYISKADRLEFIFHVSLCIYLLKIKGKIKKRDKFSYEIKQPNGFRYQSSLFDSRRFGATRRGLARGGVLHRAALCGLSRAAPRRHGSHAECYFKYLFIKLRRQDRECI